MLLSTGSGHALEMGVIRPRAQLSDTFGQWRERESCCGVRSTYNTLEPLFKGSFGPLTVFPPSLTRHMRQREAALLT